MNTDTMKKRQHMQLRLHPERNFGDLNLNLDNVGEVGSRSVTWSPPPFVDADVDDTAKSNSCAPPSASPIGSPSVTTPTLTLPSPYYDRNPVIGFPKSPPPVLANVPLQNVYDGHEQNHYADNSKVKLFIQLPTGAFLYYCCCYRTT